MGRRQLLILLVLTGCSSTSSLNTTLPSLQVGESTTTVVLTTQAPDVIGYVGNVYDGQSFDLQVGQAINRRALLHIAVPDVSTCEGQGARSLLAQLIAGKQVRIDPDGIVWRDDLDVAKAMVAYGYAKASDDTYALTDAQSPSFTCFPPTTVKVSTHKP